MQINSTTASCDNVAVMTLTPEEASLELEKMAGVAIQMWHLMEAQKPETFKSMRANKTLAPYLIRLDEQMSYKVKVMESEGMRAPEAILCIKQMKQEIGLA